MNNPNLLKLIIRNRSVLNLVRQYAIDTSKSLKDKPVKFSTSDAKKWDSMDTFMSAKMRKQPTSQPFIVIGSLMVFFVYFTFLRERNELDEIFERPLEATVPNVKEMTLKHQILQYEQMGLDTRALKEALDKETKNSRKN